MTYLIFCNLKNIKVFQGVKVQSTLIKDVGIFSLPGQLKRCGIPQKALSFCTFRTISYKPANKQPTEAFLHHWQLNASEATYHQRNSQRHFETVTMVKHPLLDMSNLVASEDSTLG